MAHCRDTFEVNANSVFFLSLSRYGAKFRLKTQIFSHYDHSSIFILIEFQECTSERNWTDGKRWMWSGSLIPQSLKMPLHEKKDEPLPIVHCSESVQIQLDLLDILERLWEQVIIGTWVYLWLCLCLWVHIYMHVHASFLCIHVHVFVHVGDSWKWRWLYQTSVKQMQRVCNNHWEFPYKKITKPPISHVLQN